MFPSPSFTPPPTDTCHEASHAFEIDDMHIVNSNLQFSFRARDVRVDLENLLCLGVDCATISQLYESLTYEKWLQLISKKDDDEDDKYLVVNRSDIPGVIIDWHFKDALVHKGRLVVHLDIHTVLQGEDVREQSLSIRQKVAKYLCSCPWTEPKFLQFTMPLFYETNVSASELSDSCSLLEYDVEPPPAGTSLKELLDAKADVEEGGAGVHAKWLESVWSEESTAEAGLQKDLQEPSWRCTNYKSDTDAETVFEDDIGEDDGEV